MAIGAFPAAKLGVLAIKQISKPIANVIKSNAKQSPIFRKYVCMPPAQCKYSKIFELLRWSICVKHESVYISTHYDSVTLKIVKINVQ